MKTPILTQACWWGAFSFQLCLFTLIQKPDHANALAARNVVSAVQFWHFDVGNQFPDFPMYDETGKRIPFSTSQPTTLVLTSSCDCEAFKIASISEGALKHGEQSIIVFTALPERLPKLKKKYLPQTRCLVTPPTEIAQFGGTKSLPLVVRISPEGIIRSIEKI